jgi:hypothetical protein
MKKGTHKYRLYNYLKEGKSISTFNAMYDLGIADLQSTIRDLKKEGVNIQSKYITVNTRYGNTTSVKSYWIE